MKKFIGAAICLVLIGLFLFLQGCAKRRNGETDAELKARKPAVYTAQGFVGLNAWTDLTEVMVRNGVLEAGAGRVSYTENERIRKALDIVAERLQSGKPADAIALIDVLIQDLAKAEQQGVLQIKDARFANTFRATLGNVRIVLASIKAVLENRKEVAPKGFQEAIPELVYIAQDTLIRLQNLATYDAAEAWGEAARLSGAIAAKNAARLGV